MERSETTQLVVYVENDGYGASLEKRKIYVALEDNDAANRDLPRIIDESGEDYLYPKAYFRLIALPESVRKAVLAAAWRPRKRPNRRLTSPTAGGISPLPGGAKAPLCFWPGSPPGSGATRTGCAR